MQAGHYKSDSPTPNADTYYRHPPFYTAVQSMEIILLSVIFSSAQAVSMLNAQDRIFIIYVFLVFQNKEWQLKKNVCISFAK